MAKSCRRQLDKILSEILASDGDLSTEDESSSFEEDVATAIEMQMSLKIRSHTTSLCLS